VLVPHPEDQGELIDALRAEGIVATFHYVPLDSSIAGRHYGRTLRPLDRADDLSRRLVRLPLWAGLSTDEVDRVIDALTRWTPTKGRR
jgi:dTDP-4-amino-4,6-dideoxygalactose transaminase